MFDALKTNHCFLDNSKMSECLSAKINSLDKMSISRWTNNVLLSMLHMLQYIFDKITTQEMLSKGVLATEKKTLAKSYG